MIVIFNLIIRKFLFVWPQFATGNYSIEILFVYSFHVSFLSSFFPSFGFFSFFFSSSSSSPGSGSWCSEHNKMVHWKKLCYRTYMLLELWSPWVRANERWVFGDSQSFLSNASTLGFCDYTPKLPCRWGLTSRSCRSQLPVIPDWPSSPFKEKKSLISFWLMKWKNCIIFNILKHLELFKEIRTNRRKKPRRRKKRRSHLKRLKDKRKNSRKD